MLKMSTSVPDAFPQPNSPLMNHLISDRLLDATH